MIAREEASLEIGVQRHDQKHAGAVCDRAGVSQRTLWAWRAGERRGAPIPTVDKVLTNLDCLWWELFERPIPGLFFERRRDDVLAWIDAVDSYSRGIAGEALIG